MRSISKSAIQQNGILRLIVLSAIMLAFTITGLMQTPQLSLADLLIGLRSQKVSLQERNRILAEAVMDRGITFTLTPEISRELATTGASPELLEAIRSKNPKPAPTPTPTPIPTPTPPDFGFYQKRADESAGKGNFTAALTDYDKAAEMRADVPTLFIARGNTHFNLKSYDKAVADYDRALELSPKSANAFLNRGISFETMGDKEKALKDYKKALELEPENAIAKSHATRVEEEFAKAEQARLAADEAKRLAETPPEFLNVGVLTSDNALRMVKPVYSPIAQRSGIGGRGEVEVEIDEEGEVTSAKATSGHQTLRSSAEYAASRSKFKPAMFNDKPIKSKGILVYNFSLK